MPSMGQIFPYVLPDARSDRRWCLRSIQITLLVRLAARLSSRSLTSLRLLPFYPFSCAVVRPGACIIVGELSEAKLLKRAQEKQPTLQNEKKVSQHVFLRRANGKLEEH